MPKQISFQAEERDTGNPFYQIFVMDLASRKYRRVSQEPAAPPAASFPRRQKDHLRQQPSRSRCSQAQRNLSSPKGEEEEGRRRRYQWDFDPYLDIFESKPRRHGPEAADHHAGV